MIFLFGITIGSFLNVCIYRIPKKEDIVLERFPLHELWERFEVV